MERRRPKRHGVAPHVEEVAAPGLLAGDGALAQVVVVGGEQALVGPGHGRRLGPSAPGDVRVAGDVPAPRVLGAGRQDEPPVDGQHLAAAHVHAGGDGQRDAVLLAQPALLVLVLTAAGLALADKVGLRSLIADAGRGERLRFASRGETLGLAGAVAKRLWALTGAQPANEWLTQRWWSRRVSGGWVRGIVAGSPR